MPRKKLTIAYITNCGARTAALKKRRLGLLKKAEELAILCDVPACAVLYAPGEPAPVVWPSPEVATSLFRKINSTECFLKPNNTMNREKLHLKRLANVRAGYSRVIAENAELSGEVVLGRCVSGFPVSNLDFHDLQSVSGALSRRAQAVDTWIRKISEGAGEGALQTSPPPLLTPSVKETVGHDGVEAFDELQTECPWMNGVGQAAPPGCDQPEIYSVETWKDDFDPAEWDVFHGSEMEWDVCFPGSVQAPPLQNGGVPLFSPPTVDGVGLKGASEIDEALQHQWCWTGSECGGEAAQADYDLTDIGGDGTSADMFTSESEPEIETHKSAPPPSPPLQNPAPLFSPPTVDGVGFNVASEIDEALQHQWCWTGSECGGDAGQADIGGDGTSAEMFTSESEPEIETYNSFTWDEFFASF